MGWPLVSRKRFEKVCSEAKASEESARLLRTANDSLQAKADALESELCAATQAGCIMQDARDHAQREANELAASLDRCRRLARRRKARIIKLEKQTQEMAASLLEVSKSIKSDPEEQPAAPDEVLQPGRPSIPGLKDRVRSKIRQGQSK